MVRVGNDVLDSRSRMRVAQGLALKLETDVEGRLGCDTAVGRQPQVGVFQRSRYHPPLVVSAPVAPRPR